MKILQRMALATVMLTLQAAAISAKPASDRLPATCCRTTEDSAAIAPMPADSASAPRRKGLISRFLAYFNDANKNKKKKRFDFSVIGGPHYASDTKLGLGLVAEGLYHSSLADSLSMPSHVALFGDVSTVGFYMLGIRGTHIAPRDRYRLIYTLYFYDFPSKFWGIGFDKGDDDSNESKLKDWQAEVKTSWLWRLTEGLYLGPTVAFDYTRARDIERIELLNGMRTETWNVGAGFTFQYDTRDVMTYPHKGVYLNLMQIFRPRFLGNKCAFSSTSFQADGYIRLWKGAVIAGDFRTEMNFGHPSWSMMAELGGSYSMRGYYEGRYRDKHKIEAQIELRQHIWKRNSLTAWVGAGNVFDKFSNLRMAHTLPNYGIGYRWEFKKNVNVRLDYGFGKKGQSTFLFNINEAF